MGGQPLKDTEKDAVKANVLKLLAETYGVEEEDFISAELEIVPAGKARDMGLDRSMILGYGHDDRVCAFPSMARCAGLEGHARRTPCCAILTDKEEIGSVGATGMGATYFENTVAELYDAVHGYDALGAALRAMQNSRMLSSDVSAGYDPNFASAFEKKNAAILGQRHVLQQVHRLPRQEPAPTTPTRNTSRRLRSIMDGANVAWQTAELGKVDVGGGGTIAYICAKYGMNVIDSGVAVLSMHAPYEIINKADLYEGYKCYRAFLKDAKAL